MKKSTLFLFATLFSIGLFAGGNEIKLSDNINTTVGPAYKVIDAQYKRYFSDKKEVITTVKTRGKEVHVQVFDINSMKEIQRKMYKDFPKKFVFQDIIQVETTLYYFFSKYEKKPEKHFDLYVREIDMKTGNISASKKIVSSSRKIIPFNSDMFSGNTTTKIVDEGAALSGQMYSNFKIKHSTDGSKFVIHYYLKPLVRKDSENFAEYGFYVTDKSFKQLFGGEVKMPYTEDKIDPLTYTVANDGNCYILAHKPAQNVYELLEVKEDLKATPISIDIDGNKLIKNPRFFENPKGNLVFASYYANGLETQIGGMGAMNLMFNTNGIYYVELSKAGKVIRNNTVDFPIELIKQYESKREKKKADKKEAKGKAGILELQLIELQIHEDGSIVFIGEQMYQWRTETIEYTANGPRRRTHITSHFENIVATKIDKNGKVVWMKKLPKQQNGGGRRGGMGVKYIKGNGKHYMLFLDNVKNANISVNEVPKAHADGHGGFLTAYILNDATGEWEKHTIFDSRELKGTQVKQFYTERIFDGMENVVFLEIYAKGKQDRLIKMEVVK